MKLIIQIPCFNEEETLGETLSDLPKQVPGVDCIEILIIDDGSSDKTLEVARKAGVHHIVRHTTNRGLAAAFQTGVDACLERGADVILNTDGDHQYPGSFIPQLLEPLLSGKADMVIADRQMSRRTDRTLGHRLLQSLGSAVVRRISGTKVPDAPSGFRAMSREAALRLDIMTGYTYTLEAIVQSGEKGLRLAFVPIETNPTRRESRLKRTEGHYVLRSAATLLRLYATYRPLRTFLLLGLPFLLAGSTLWIRYLVLMIQEGGLRGTHLQSVIVGAASILIAFVLGSLGILGDLIARNRVLSERLLYLSKQSRFPRVVVVPVPAPQREKVPADS
ncbi:MAG TPA: glycosyltransferase family 2 protein [Planctomycetota bacterium]|nr:glycosyltransferase family 2 protein [Planctomycetota bacterium]